MFAIISSAMSIPDPIVHQSYRYYEIKGRHEVELVQQMNIKAPVPGGGRYWGNTSTSVRWTFATQQGRGGQCVLKNPKVLVVITTTLPRWNPPAGTESGVIAKWDKFYAALKHHEGEHGQFAKDQGEAFAALMRAHPSDASCPQLEAFLNAAGKKITGAYSQKDAELDRRTQHGATEGVAISW